MTDKQASFTTSYYVTATFEICCERCRWGY